MPGTLIKDRGIIHGGPPPLAGHGGGGDPEGRGSSRRVSFTGLIVLLGAVLMFFAAFISAFIVRRGTSKDWVGLPLPHLVYWNTAVLLASSLVLEFARRALRSGHRTAFNRLWTLGTLLGAAFLAGQAMVWQQLHNAGFYVASNPSSSFFYVLTVAHALHVWGGLAALAYVDVQALRLRLGPGKRTTADVSTAYWHFLLGLWILLMILFVYWG